MWLATQVVPMLQAPLSLLLDYVGVATVSTMLRVNNLARCALIWAQTPLGLVAVKGHRNVVIWLESRTQLSWNQRSVRLA